MNILLKIYRFLGKDIEFPRKAWLQSILSIWSMAASIILSITILLEKEYGGPVLVGAMIVGGLFGCVLSFVVNNRVKKKIKFF